jgi:hypothetical protein
MDKYLIKVLKKMCHIVNVNYNEINFKSHDWYLHHQWTKDQENKFKKWFIRKLNWNKKMRQSIMNFDSKSNIIETVNWFVFMYGWKYKDNYYE